MFSRDDRGDDIFANSTFDSSNPDKIIIREKEAPKKKVRRRVKKGTKNQYLSNKTAKVKVTSGKEKNSGNNVDNYSKAKAKEVSEKYKIPRLSEIEKKKDDFDNNSFGEFRSSAADWRDKKYPDYSGLENLSSNSFTDGFKEGFTGVTLMQGIAAALLLAIFVLSLLTTNAYARVECRENREKAMSQLVRYGETSSMQVAAEVEDVETPISLEEAKPQIAKAVSLVLSSVEKDLKIKLVDEDDTLVKNVQWSVTITDSDGKASEESDDDKDGIIHLTDVSAGEYSVELNPSNDLVDYEVPMSAQTVSVKARVEYKVIADIKEEIKSEKEINAAVEDAAGNQAAEAEAAPPATQDTVEWVESTKTVTGEGYVEATPDLTKTASIKKNNLFAALVNNIKNTASSAFGNASIAYPVLLVEGDGNTTGEGDTTEGEKTPAECSHEWGSPTGAKSKGNGTHDATQTCSKCSETKNVTLDCTFSNNKCTECGYEKPAEHSHTIKYTSDGAGKHTTSCSGENCPGFSAETSNCDTAGSNGECSKCGYKKQAESSISLDKTSASINVGDTMQLKATVTPSGSAAFTSSDASVATVDSSGKVTALKAGSAKITATANGKNATCEVTVNAKSDNAISLSGNTSVKVGETTTITATLTPSTAKVSSATTADSAIATASVSENSITVKGVKEGNTKLTVKSDNGKEATVTITVTAQAQKYSDDAQLYDSNKNALYVLENGSYRLAKYKDYREDPGRKFYRKSEEYKYTGWQTLDGKTYYFNKNNEAVTGDQIIGGVTYHFGTDGALSQGSGTLGIDVSKYQPSINWSSVKASGVNYVIIRCGYRGSSTGVLVEDPYFKSHIKGAKAAGLKVGIYFFTTAISEAEAVEEASMVAYLCKGYGIDYPVFMDCESSGRPGYNGMPASQRTAIIKAFCNTIRSAGYTPGVYANKTWLTSYMNAGELSGYKIWLAQYNAAGPTYSGRYDLWQYTSKGTVNGISGFVDMNQSYLGY